jgi:hypothetical protein
LAEAALRCERDAKEGCDGARPPARSACGEAAASAPRRAHGRRRAGLRSAGGCVLSDANRKRCQLSETEGARLKKQARSRGVSMAVVRTAHAPVRVACVCRHLRAVAFLRWIGWRFSPRTRGWRARRARGTWGTAAPQPAARRRSPRTRSGARTAVAGTAPTAPHHPGTRSIPS